MTGISYEQFVKSQLATCFVNASSNNQQNKKEAKNPVYFVKVSAELPNDLENLIGSKESPDGSPEKFRLLLDPYAIAIGNRGTLISLAKKHLNRTEPKFIKQFQDREGYNRIPGNISAPSRQVARLVATAWHPGHNQGLEVDHIDGIRSNDAADNLEWVTHRENIRRIKVHPPHHVWPKETKVLLIDTYHFHAQIVGPHDVRRIIGSPNSTKLLRGLRHYSNGWLVLVDPTFDLAVKLCIQYKVMAPEILSLLYRIFCVDTGAVVENDSLISKVE